MLEEMQLLCMMMLLIGHGLLIKGCFKINQTIPDSTDRLGTKFDSISTVLDELADIIDEVASGSKTPPMANPLAGGSIPEMITSLLMSKMQMPSEYGPQENERTIHEIDPTPIPKTTD